MEEWLAFVETFSTYLLHELPWKVADIHVRDMFFQQWEHLRLGTLYFLRYHEGQHTEERIRSAQQHLLDYGCLVEKVTVLTYTFLYTLPSNLIKQGDHSTLIAIVVYL